MPDKKSFVLRMDSDMYKALEKWASDEFRSVNGQIEWMLTQQLKEAGRLKLKPGPSQQKDPTEEEKSD